MRGRAALDPERGGEPMCARHKLADRLSAIGVNVQETLCQRKGDRCPHFDHCGYQRQRRALQEGKGGVFFGAHEYAFNPSPAPRPDLVVVDESLVLRAVAECSFHPDLLLDSGPWQKVSLSAALDYRQVAAAIRDALVEHSGRELAYLRSAGIDKRQLKRAAKYLRAIEEETITGIHPSMDDEQIERKIDAVRRSELYKHAALFRQIRREWDSGRAGFNSVVCLPDAIVEVNGRQERQRRVYVYYIKRPRIPDQTPMLLTDGTGSLALNRMVFGREMTEQRIAVERDAHVIQVRRKIFSKQSITGCSARGEPIGSKAAAAAQLRTEIAKVVKDAPGERKFVGATKMVEKVLKDLLPEGTATAHFSDMRGRNEFEQCDTGIVVGREQISVAKLEALTRAFTAEDAEPFFSTVSAEAPTGQLHMQVRGRRMRDGSVELEIVQVHPHPPCQEVLEQIREAELVQAVDRVRPIFNRRRLIVLTSVVADVTVDRSVLWRELVAGGNRFEQAFARTGGTVALLSAGELARCNPDFWESADAVKKDKKRLGLNGDRNQIETLFEKRPHLIAEYRRPGQRGQPCRAAIASSVADARAALEVIVGPVAVFKVVTTLAWTLADLLVPAARTGLQRRYLKAPIISIIWQQNRPRRRLTRPSITAPFLSNADWEQIRPRLAARASQSLLLDLVVPLWRDHWDRRKSA